MINKKFKIALGTLAVTGLLVSSSLQAASQSVTASAEFVAPLSISGVSNMSFGLISTDMASSNTIVIATNDAVTDASNRVVGGSQAAASMTVSATGSQTIEILVDNPSTPTGYTLGSFTCKYDVGAESGCGTALAVTSVASATLKIGATLTGNGSDVVGADDATFDVTVTYQ